MRGCGMCILWLCVRVAKPATKISFRFLPKPRSPTLAVVTASAVNFAPADFF